MLTSHKRIFFTLGLFISSFSGPLTAQNLDLINGEDTVVQHPKVSYDGTKMVFLANYDGRLKPYLSEKNGDTWGIPELIFNDEINGQYFIEYPQLSFDNNRLYFSGRTVDADFDILYSDLVEGQWTTPEPIFIKGINSTLNESGPTVSPNGKIILFTRPLPSDAKAEVYCQEIWMSQQSETGTWSEPALLNPDYNPGCVCAPYYALDNKTFFFSSYQDVYDAEGKRISKGNFNLYWAKLDGLFKFKPVVVQSLINDSEHQISFSLDRNGIAYYSEGDIYKSNEKRRYSKVVAKPLDKTHLPETNSLISGRITDIDGKILPAEISVINPYTSKVIQRTPSDAEGYYQLFVPTGSEYTVLARKENYSVQSKLANLDTISNATFDFSLFPQVNMKFNIFDNEFYFPLDAELTLYDKSFKRLKSFLVKADGEQAGNEIPLGKELYIVFNSEDYHPDTLMLPFDKEVIFSEFDFDIELKRKLKDLSLSFTDESTGNKLGLEVTVYNVTRNEKTVREVKDGKVTLRLRDGEVYEISTSAQGYSYYSAKFDMSEEQPEGEEVVVEAQLKSIENTSIVLGNITFEYNSYNLTAESYPETNKLVAYLKENDSYRVEISAHTDDKGAEDYNLKLSRLRANAVMEYLQDNGIGAERLLAIGYGETKPLHPNDTEEHMALNRRVEFKILESNE